MTQTWTIERHWIGRHVSNVFATVSSATGSHRVSIAEFSFSQRSLTLLFYPRVGELVFNNGRVSLGGIALEGLVSAESHHPADALVQARLELAIEAISQTALAPEYDCGIPVRAEIHRYEFLVSDEGLSRNSTSTPRVDRPEVRQFAAIEAIQAGVVIEIVDNRFVRRAHPPRGCAIAIEPIREGDFVDCDGRVARRSQSIPEQYQNFPRIPGYTPDRHGWMIPDSVIIEGDLQHLSWANDRSAVIRMEHEDSRSPKICKSCTNYHGQSYGGNFLVCGMYPYGNGEDCSDFEGKS